MTDPLLSHIKRFIALSPNEEEMLLGHIEHRQLANKEHILKAGQVCDHYCFVVTGVLRMYATTSSGHEHIVQFGIDNWWICDYQSFESQTPSVFHIQALEPSTVLIIGRKQLEELFQKLPKLERYFRLILQRAYSATLMRVHYIFTSSGEERYRHFNSLFPDFVQRIPQYMLASYLGFTPEFLSKIRAKKL